ncbi:hypothetical protein RB595_008615 [Gaeumannomyces hyphopodioides]
MVALWHSYSLDFSICLAAAAVVCLLFIPVACLRQRKARSRDSVDQNVALSFPPSRRHVLQTPAFPGCAEKGQHAPAPDVPSEILRKNALPTTRAIRASDGGELFTPTGFSLRDISSLGNFPDYSLLSGVPHPRPCGDNFDIKRTTFRPFRPFRWEYHQTMALSKLDPDYWLELEKNYFKSMEARRTLIEKHGDRVLFHDPGSELACRELMEVAIQFLCKRYPKYFHLEPGTDSRSSGAATLVNNLLGTRTVLSPRHQHPLRVLAANVPEDFALMLRSEHDGHYRLRAAVVCSSVGWDIAAKRGLGLDAIHAPVPHYAARMAPSMKRYFSRMPTDRPIQRCSWGLEDSEPLFSSPHVAGEGKGEDGWHRSAFSDADIAAGRVGVDDVRLRCDWQTLRRLPLSGAVCFNFKAVFTPLAALRSEPFVPALLARVLALGDRQLVGPYKCDGHVRDLALAALEGWAAEQVEEGIVPAGWEVRTLDEHPFYLGWEERWREQQRF